MREKQALTARARHKIHRSPGAWRAVAPRLVMDELDFRILREIFTGDGDYFRTDRATAEDIARKLGLHRNTVGARIRRMTRANAYLPASLDIEAPALGLVGCKAFLDVPPDRRTPATREALFHLESVVAILEYVEGWDLVVYAEDETSLRSKVELAKAITGATRAQWDIHTSRDYPPAAQVRIAKLDARLLAAMLRDARRGFGSLGKELGKPARTLQRRWERLRAQGLVYMLPAGNVDVAGMSTGLATIDFDRARQRQVVAQLEKLFPNAWQRNVATTGRAHYFLFARTIPELQDPLLAARKVPGVSRTELRVGTGAAANPGYQDWLARVLERRAA